MMRPIITVLAGICTFIVFVFYCNLDANNTNNIRVQQDQRTTVEKLQLQLQQQPQHQQEGGRRDNYNDNYVNFNKKINKNGDRFVVVGIEDEMNHDDQELPKPLEVLDQYMRWHSYDTLMNEHAEAISSSDYYNSNFYHRKFAIGYYSCPMQAGNRIHHFLSALLWAVITNRTILWKYYDHESCLMLGAHFDQGICEHTNTEDECEVVLRRQPWIPSYDEWKHLLPADNNDNNNNNNNNNRPPGVVVNFWATHPKQVVGLRREEAFANHSGFTTMHFQGLKYNPWQDKYTEMYTGLDSASYTNNGFTYNGMNVYKNATTIIFPMMLDKYYDLGIPEYRNNLLTSEWGRTTAKTLYSLGPDFMYGMLYRQSFIPQEIISSKNTETAEGVKPDPNAFSIAVHSRHQFESEIGDIVDREVICLERLLRKRKDGQSCHVYIMADRTATIETLHKVLPRQFNCTGLSALHDDEDAVVRQIEDDEDDDDGYGNDDDDQNSIQLSQTSWRKEHGPYAGGSFFVELELIAKNARHGFIGGHRSSSNLIIELMTYDSMIETWKKNQIPTLDIEHCIYFRDSPTSSGSKVFDADGGYKKDSGGYKKDRRFVKEKEKKRRGKNKSTGIEYEKEKEQFQTAKKASKRYKVLKEGEKKT